MLRLEKNTAEKSRKRTHGLAIGRFMPPHKGHIFLCETGVECVDDMTVLVSVRDDDPISIELRLKWLKEMLPTCEFLALAEEDCAALPENTTKRAANIRAHLKRPVDMMFGTKSYVFPLAKELGAAPVIVDPEHDIFKASSAEVRKDVAGNWDMLPLPVRPHFQKRICLMGSESTGKSAACEKLAPELGLHMPEYGRTYDAWYKQTGEIADTEWQVSDFVDLARTHIAMRKSLARHAGPVFLEDTDQVQTLVWAEMLGFGRPKEMDPFFKPEELADLYVLFTPEVPWVDDGTRYFSTQEERWKFFGLCREFVSEFGRPYEIVDGEDFEARYQKLRSVLKAHNAPLSDYVEQPKLKVV